MHNPIKIAYLEDDPTQGIAVVKWLKKKAFLCTVFSTPDTMKEALKAIAFDAIMLDVQIDGEDAGLEMLEHIREKLGLDTPVLMVSAEPYWQAALSGGADDFLEKPLAPETLVVHLHRLIRPIAQASLIENYPPYQLNAMQQQATLKGDLVDLSCDEYELASTLFRYFGKVLSHSQLMEKLSTRPVNVTMRVLERDLNQIKRKMGLRGMDGWRLESVYRHGYRLVNARYDYLYK